MLEWAVFAVSAQKIYGTSKDYSKSSVYAKIADLYLPYIYSIVQDDLLDSQKSVLDSSVFRDLNIFCGQDEDLEKIIFYKIDNTKTVFGKVMLQNFLHPRYKNVKDLKNAIQRKADILKFSLLLQQKSTSSLM